MWDDLPYRNCNIFIDQTHFQFNIDDNNLNSGDNWSMPKNRVAYFIHLNVDMFLQK